MSNIDREFETSPQSLDIRWYLVFITIVAMLGGTISAPESFRDGVVPIVSPSLISKIKLLSRGLSIAAIGYGLFLSMAAPNFNRVLKIMAPMIALAFFCCLSSLWSYQKSTSLMQATTFSSLIGLGLLVACTWKTEEELSRLLKFCGVLLVAISLFLLALYFVKPNLGALTRNSTGLFHSTNAGSTASLGILLVLSSWIIWGWKWARLLILPAILIHVCVMLIGENRLSVGMALMVSTCLFFAIGHRALVAWAVLGFFVAGVLYLCLDPRMELMEGVKMKLEKFVSQGQTQSQLSDFSGRAEMWEKIWYSFQESPWLGHGYFMSSKDGSLVVWGVKGNWTAHNMALQLLVTTGVVGVLLFLIGMGNIALRLLGKIGSSDVLAHRVSLFCLGVTLWYLGWGLLNESIFGPLQPESVIFGVLLGLGTAVAAGNTAPLELDSHEMDEESIDDFAYSGGWDMPGGVL